MGELAELHRFNAWANRSLLDGVRRLRPDQLRERRDEMYSTVLEVLNHLALVEAAYVALMGGGPFERPAPDVPPDVLERLLARTGTDLVALAEGDLRAKFHVPWFDRDLTRFQGLSQVLTHSANHRADVNQWLPRFGVESTRQDYIDLALAER